MILRARGRGRDCQNKAAGGESTPASYGLSRGPVILEGIKFFGAKWGHAGALKVDSKCEGGRGCQNTRDYQFSVAQRVKENLLLPANDHMQMLKRRTPLPSPLNGSYKEGKLKKGGGSKRENIP